MKYNSDVYKWCDQGKPCVNKSSNASSNTRGDANKSDSLTIFTSTQHLNCNSDFFGNFMATLDTD